MFVGSLSIILIEDAVAYNDYNLVVRCCYCKYLIIFAI